MSYVEFVSTSIVMFFQKLMHNLNINVSFNGQSGKLLRKGKRLGSVA